MSIILVCEIEICPHKHLGGLKIVANAQRLSLIKKLRY